MKAADLRQMSDEQLNLTLTDVVKNLFHLRFQSATERLETPSEITKAKRDVARIKTVIRERELDRMEDLEEIEDIEAREDMVEDVERPEGES